MTTWLRLCVAAIAAHVIDDSFVQPELAPRRATTS